MCVCLSTARKAATAPSLSLALIMQYSSASFSLLSVGMLGSNGSGAITRSSSMEACRANGRETKTEGIGKSPSFEGILHLKDTVSSSALGLLEHLCSVALCQVHHTGCFPDSTPAERRPQGCSVAPDRSAGTTEIAQVFSSAA